MIGPEIRSYIINNDDTRGYFEISCGSGETISSDEIESIRNEIQDYSNILLKFCKPLPFARLTETLGMNINQTSKELSLDGLYNLTAEHLTGIDGHGVRLSLNIYFLNSAADKVISVASLFYFNLFSTIPKLKELSIIVGEFWDLDYHIPDISKLPLLESLTVFVKHVVKPESKL